MSDFGTVAPDGLVNQGHVDRYEAYAHGGAGLVITEACSVVRMHENRDTLVLEDDACIVGMRRISCAIHKYGTVALAQIMLTGLATMPEDSIAAISREDFLRYKKAFVDAALRCQKAGFDGVELHAAHGMYLGEVSETSTREDGYGGELLGRLRLVTELLQEIRALCGRDFVLAVRFGNADLEELVQMAVAFEKAGADLLDVSFGMRQYQPAPAGFGHDSKVYAASLVKERTRLPVICVGNIFTGEEAESILAKGLADMVAVGRGHLADRHGLARRWLAKNRLRACAAHTANGSVTASSARQGRRPLLFSDKAIESGWLQKLPCQPPLPGKTIWYRSMTTRLSPWT